MSPRFCSLWRHNQAIGRAFLLGLVSGACSPSLLANRGPQQNATPTEAARTSIRIPQVSDSTHPLAIWMRDLVEPRLASLTGLEWSCSTDGAAYIFKLQKFTVECSQVISTTRDDTGLQLDCLSDHLLRVRSAKRKCSGQDAPTPLLQHLRLPAGNGLFKRSIADGKLVPNMEIFPSLAAALTVLDPEPQGPWDLSPPSTKMWLSNSSETGAVVFELRPLKNPTDRTQELLLRTQLSEIRSFMTKERKPSWLMAFSPDLNLPQKTTSPASPNDLQSPGKPPFVSLSSISKDPLLKSACEYLDRWLKAHQILAGIDPPETINDRSRLELQCAFGWQDDPRPDFSVIVTRLPLPLASNESFVFPVRTAEEARSLAVLQSLKLLK